jgi:hypothetical protein
MVWFYWTDFDVPDFGAYTWFYNAKFPAKDCFSSLFIAIFNGDNPFLRCVLYIVSLFSLSFCIFSFLYFFYKVFTPKLLEFILSVLFVISSGIWYYIYGKLVYDFPFSMLTFSFALIVLTKVFIDNNRRMFYLSLLSLLIGFYLSWKPYNIFLVVGTAVILLIHENTRYFIYKNLKTIKFIFIIILFFIVGMLLGNFHLIDNFSETLKGIKAYQSSYSFYNFLFFNERLVWDHVNLMSYTATSFLLPTFVFVLFVFPLLLRKYLYVLLSSFLSMCMFIYITYFSPGYPWHGFSFSAFIILLFLVLLGYFKSLSLWHRRILLIVCYVVVSLQFIYTFTKYVPMQARWFYVTNEIGNNMLENKISVENTINEYVFKNNINKSDYMLYVNFKRFILKERQFRTLIDGRGREFSFYSPPIGMSYLFSVYDIRQNMVASMMRIQKSLDENLINNSYEKTTIYNEGNIVIDVYKKKKVNNK